MGSKQKLAVSIVVGLAVLAGAYSLSIHWLRHQSMPSTLTIDVTAASQGERSGPRTSEGERLLLDGDGDRHSLKAEGILAYRLGSFVEAERLFSESFTQNEPDPETLIYFNNALVSQQAEFVTIAVVVSFNGETAIHTSKEILRGVAQAQREFIKTGNALKVVIGDDQLDPQIAQQLALSFAENPAILGVIGHPDSDMSLAAGDVYQQVGLVMMSATSTAISLTGIGDFIFRTIPNDLIAAQTMATYVSDELKSRKIAVFYNSQSDYSRSLYQSFLDALGPQGTVVITADMDGQAPSFDLAQFMGRMEAEGAEAIALLTNASKLSEVLEIIQINQRRLPIIAGDALYNLKILEAGAVNAEGLVVAIPWHILVNPSAIFPVSARELWQGDVSWRTALSYDATRALSKALQETPTYDRQSLQNILADPNFSATGAINKINFSPSGDRNQSILMVRVVQGNRYGLDYQFVPF